MPNFESVPSGAEEKAREQKLSANFEKGEKSLLNRFRGKAGRFAGMLMMVTSLAIAEGNVNAAHAEDLNSPDKKSDTLKGEDSFTARSKDQLVERIKRMQKDPQDYVIRENKLLGVFYTVKKSEVSLKDKYFSPDENILRERIEEAGGKVEDYNIVHTDIGIYVAVKKVEGAGNDKYVAGSEERVKNLIMLSGGDPNEYYLQSNGALVIAIKKNIKKNE